MSRALFTGSVLILPKSKELPTDVAEVKGLLSLEAFAPLLVLALLSGL